MAQIQKSELREGVYMAEISGLGGTDVRVMHENSPLPDITVTDMGDDISMLSLPIPARVLHDGVHSFVILDGDDQKLGQFAIMAGDLADSDIRAELDLLRAELDMLKTAFRRHCVETMGQTKA